MSPSEVKASLAKSLGPSSMPYWRALSDFLAGKMSHAEFEDLALEHLKTPQQIQLHNCLLMEIIGAACTSEPDIIATSTMLPPAKRRRVLPGTGDQAASVFSTRMRHWIVSIPNAEREAIKSLGKYAETHPTEQRFHADEVKQDRGFQSVQGSRMPVTLCTLANALPSIPDLSDRVLATASDNKLRLGAARPFIKLFNQALEEFMIKLVTATLTTITRSDTNYDSIQAPVNSTESSSFNATTGNKTIISVMSIATTMYITPSLITFPSPALLRVYMREFQWPLVSEAEAHRALVKGPKELNLSGTPFADYYRLLRATRSGGPVLLQDYSSA